MKIKTLIFGMFFASVSMSAFSQDSDCETRDKLFSNSLHNHYQEIACFSEGLAVAKQDETHRYLIDTTGKQIADISKYDQVESFDKGLAYVITFSKDLDDNKAKVGLIDKTGKLIIPQDYLALLQPFQNGKIRAEKYFPNNTVKMGVIDLQNQVLIPFEFGYIDESYEGVRVVVKGCSFNLMSDNNLHQLETCRFGVIDEHNKILVPFDYQFIGSYKNGVALAQKDNMLGKIDTHGNIVVPFTNENQRALLKERMAE